MSIIHIPSINRETPGEGAFPWATCSALPLIYCQGPTVLSQCSAAGFVSFSWDLGMSDYWLSGGLRSLDKPSSLPPSLSFLPSLSWQLSSGWCCSWRSRASHTFPFRSSSQRECGFIFLCPPLHLEDHQHCSPSRDRHGGCVLARRLQRGFAIEILPARAWGWVDGSLTFLHGHCHQTPISGAAILLNR